MNGRLTMIATENVRWKDTEFGRPLDQQRCGIFEISHPQIEEQRSFVTAAGGAFDASAGSLDASTLRTLKPLRV